MKKILFKRKPIVCLTAYNKFTAQIADEFCDLILVGDSLGMAYYGFSTTRAVSLDDIIRHAKSVKLGIKKSIMVVDMPFGTYNTKKSALKNAKKIIQVTKCDAVKLEGGKEKSEIIKYLIKNKISRGQAHRIFCLERAALAAALLRNIALLLSFVSGFGFR